MPDEHMMPPAERAAYANGWHARDAEVAALQAEIVALKRVMVEGDVVSRGGPGHG
jgi:hypothetical protein